MPRRERPEVCLATSHGGHLELLLALAPAWRERRHVVVTPESPQADELRRAGTETATVANPLRNPVLLVRTASRSAWLAARLRPRVVISAGAGAAVPFCLAAKALGARLIFIETMARVYDGSTSGRALYRVADHFLVQWPELSRRYPRAELCRPALLSDIGPAAGDGERSGTVVAAGSHRSPFDRLLALADEAAAQGVLPQPVVVQGRAERYAPRSFEVRAALEPEEMRRAIERSEVVLCHAGSGLIAHALRSGKTPLVLPRRRVHGEHVDDHQVAMAEHLAALGLVVPVEEGTDLAPLLDRARCPPVPAETPGRPLAERLRELVEAAL